MKKNLLTIIILALTLMNMVLTAVIVFTVVPTTIKTNSLISKVASTIDLELEASTTESEKPVIQFDDIEVYKLEEEMILNLKKEPNDSKEHHARISVSFELNMKAPDYETLMIAFAKSEDTITEYITEEFLKYSNIDVAANKENIKAEVLRRLQEKFNSDFFISMSIGKFIVE